MDKRPGVEESVVAQELGSEVVVLTSSEMEEDEGSPFAKVMFAFVVGVVVKTTVQLPDIEALPFVATVAVEEEPREICEFSASLVLKTDIALNSVLEEAIVRLLDPEQELASSNWVASNSILTMLFGSKATEDVEIVVLELISQFPLPESTLVRTEETVKLPMFVKAPSVTNVVLGESSNVPLRTHEPLILKE